MSRGCSVREVVMPRSPISSPAAPHVTARIPGRASPSTQLTWREATKALAEATLTLVSLWGDGDTVHMALSEARNIRDPEPRLRRRELPLCRPPACPRRSGSSARSADLYGLVPRGCADDSAPGSTMAAGASGIRSAAGRCACRIRRPTGSCRSKARACTRFRSGRCTPASSSRGISASPPMARRWCGWRSGSATCTRASMG